MPIKFHPNAEANFNERAAEIKALLQRVTIADDGTKEFVPNVHVAATLSPGDIKDMRHVGTIDSLSGELLDWRFQHNGAIYALDKPACEQARSLAYKVWMSQRKMVSKQSVFDELMHWIDPGVESIRTFCAHLVHIISPQLTIETHWVPIAHLHIQSEIRIGEVTFRAIDAGDIDSWSAEALKHSQAEAQLIEGYFQTLREKYGGFAAGVIDVEATPEYGAISAYETVSQAVALLGIFGPSSVDIRQRTLTVPFGDYLLPHYDVWTQAKAGCVPRFIQHTKPPLIAAWILNDETIQAIKAAGLERVSEIFGLREINEFQARLLKALLVFSRANASESSADKVFFLSVALEMMLLKNDTESIQLALGDRLAFTMRTLPGERLAIVDLVKEVYKLRSKWVHHGEAPEENITILNRFLTVAWEFFVTLIRNESRFKTVEDFIRAAEQIKYS